MKKFYIVLGLVWIALVGSIYWQNSLKAKGATTFTTGSCYTAAATSTLTYMTPGTATTTLACGLSVSGADTAVVMVEVNASSTLTAYNFSFEESLDGQDWFPVAVNQSASTTNPFNVTPAIARYQFASSTLGLNAAGASANTQRLGVSGTDNRNHLIFNVPVRMQRIRVSAGIIGDVALANLNGAVWMQILPKSQL